MIALPYTRITHPQAPEHQEIQALYEEAFPEEERRVYTQLLSLLDQPDMYLYAVKKGRVLAGFYIYWCLNGFCFLEHLVVSPAWRGQGIGQQMMRHLLQQENRPVLLEVEHPTSAIQQKRIDFYQRLGFALHDAVDYLQPPYRPHGPAVPLYLMSGPVKLSTRSLLAAAAVIKNEVYERFYT